MLFFSSDFELQGLLRFILVERRQILLYYAENYYIQLLNTYILTQLWLNLVLKLFKITQYEGKKSTNE